ncbi:type II toxin-antitoxin system RelE/ParE family toxin [Luteimonas fraxinea]|uniref:Type II toxin-antitoxin system RelE/ParE family toxin n=1 Tax=Luteimonas fraxinea TaxID=2901869 RepID=A0ABS8UF22_9GAMM|nr:type II toxin-antitoxin system RelE/ParE family toxin [Luteimonas fraxinea]MCD9098068.1 type II toxin-antitoxin system RelE/ParE family toxin [Luteimonas fraxinea]UHH09207.1 type II toxin-antitoxin system RelE/ParE family toxin [Luteimonas fraxinea]
MPLDFAFSSDAARRAFMSLPPEIRQQFGHDLNAVQEGQRPVSDFEDVSASVGRGAIELKENGSPAYRAVYCTKFENTVFVFHAFEKTAQGVDRANIATAKKRYNELVADVNARAQQAKRARK